MRLFGTLLGTALACLVPSAAHAAPAAKSDCVLTGNASVERGTVIYSRSRGGEPVAELTGMPIELRLSELPGSDDTSRATLSTTGEQGIDLRGHIDAGSVQLFTQTSVLVEPGLWIAPGVDVEFEEARPGALLVRAEAPKLSREHLETWAPCSALGLDTAGLGSLPLPERARAYRARDQVTALYRAPSAHAELLATLQTPGYSDGLLFWVTHVRDGFARAHYQGSVVVEGWTAADSLVAVPNSSQLQPAAPPTTARQYPDLKVAGEYRRFRAERAVDLYQKPTQTSTRVGSVRAGSEVLVIDSVRGWVGILPSSLAVTAPNGGQFWARKHLLET